MAKRAKQGTTAVAVRGYEDLVAGLSGLLEQSRRVSARAVNGILTATYWEVGREIVEFEQGGQARAGYGEELLERLGRDLSREHGRGFSARNLRKMRTFFLGWEIWPTPSAKLEARVRGDALAPLENVEPRAIQTGLLPGPVEVLALAAAFPLPWSHYVRLLSVLNTQARAFYEAEAVRGGWSVRQLDRQVATQYYERVQASKTPEALRARGLAAKPEDLVTVEEEVKDPYLLEFLNLKDEYSESELEEALIRHLEWFMLELGAGFTFVARQKRILIDRTWFYMDLLFFHRGLRCLVIVDLKRGEFTPADAGQMNTYLNYAKEHLMMPEENPPVGIILCSDKNDAVVHYATGGIHTRVFASKYLDKLPNEETLREEIRRTQRALAARAVVSDTPAPPELPVTKRK